MTGIATIDEMLEEIEAIKLAVKSYRDQEKTDSEIIELLYERIDNEDYYKYR